MPQPPLPFGPWWEAYRGLTEGATPEQDEFPLMPALLAIGHILQGGQTWDFAETALAELVEQVEQRCADIPAEAMPERTIRLLTVLREAGFEGDRDNYEDPCNSYLDRVLERRRGLPITLSALAIHLARTLEIPLVGISFPGHFVVGLGLDEPAPRIFDPFFGGRRLGNTALAELAARATGQGTDWQQYLRPASSRAIVSRVLRNLVRHLEHADQPEHTHAARRLLQITTTDD